MEIFKPVKKIFITLSIVTGIMMIKTADAEDFRRLKSQTDIGTVNKNGTVEYDPDIQEYIIGGSGQNMWFDHDDFFYTWEKITGDFVVTARFEFLGKGIDTHRKTGWMIRRSLEPDAAYVDGVIHGDGLTSMQFRREKGALTEEIKANVQMPDILQMERKGNSFIFRTAFFGEPLQISGLINLKLGQSLYVGIPVCAHNETAFEKVRVSNLRITIPAPAGFEPYQDYSGSRLEILDVFTGLREIVYQTAEAIEAPNWTRDGSALIYNSKGLLYRFPLESKKPVPINTHFADRNNNDHVISFDGLQLGISHHMDNEPGGGSTIFTLPIEGGVPKRITQKTPSYFHGWSPDGQYLVYTAERNGSYDIYKIPSLGGEEIQLTNVPVLDDGSEYTADGEWIYFNSARTGSMHIWRMRPDGSDPQQITFDSYNNWFPHPSPDGKWLVFLSYPPEVDAQDHPHYKHVLLRIKPLDGGETKVVAYLYGGQGTINVPSWSPDSKKIAFVSYSFNMSEGK